MVTTWVHTSHTCFNIPLYVSYTPIAIHLSMAFKQSFSSRLLQSCGMKFPGKIGIAWKKGITFCRISLTVIDLLVILWCSGEETSGRFPQWLRKAAEKILYTHSMHPPPICMVACADLPLDLKYAAWAELKGRASAQLLLK